jgi:hypothetical protein
MIKIYTQKYVYARYTNDEGERERSKMDFRALPGTKGHEEMSCFLVPTGNILSSGYIKFSTLSLLSLFGAPVCPCVNSCLSVFVLLSE